MKKNLSDNIIGFITEGSPNALIAMLAILKSGNSFVPIDLGQPDMRINSIVNDCNIKILLTENKYLAKALQITKNAPSIKHVISVDMISECNITYDQDNVKLHDYRDYMKGDSDIKSYDVNNKQLAYLIYTSGSTGMPKGIQVSHENLIPLLYWAKEYFDFDEHTKALQNLNHCFDFGIFEVLTTLCFGGTLYFTGKTIFANITILTDYINKNGINTIHTTPSFFDSISNSDVKWESLEKLHLGGEVLRRHVVDKAFSIGDNCSVYNGYGPTEGTINCSIFKIGRKSEYENTMPIGKVSANNSIYILRKSLEPVPIGTYGELFIGGMGVARGYFNLPDLTADKFIPNPFGNEAGSRLYRTGDLCRYLPDDNIEFIGRIDNQVKIRGYRIEPGEIEAVLNQHSFVTNSVILCREDDPGNKRLVAYVMLNSKGEDRISELRNYLHEKLPDYMIPSAYVVLEGLPLTPNGKIDYKALPVPDNAYGVESSYIAPRTPTEERLTKIWEDVLGVERVGIYDNFFELGGHSLLLMRVLSKLRQEGSKEIRIGDLFRYPTIASLSNYLTKDSLGAVEVAESQETSIFGGRLY